MPSTGRWRHPKIVAPASRAQEISGGIKNALDRGEPLAKAKQTFINAGYTPQEVQAATQMIRAVPSQRVKPLSPSQSQPIQPQQTSEPAKTSSTGDSKKIIIILAIIGTVILITALALGLFWDKIF